jgi:hypothetical protein
METYYTVYKVTNNINGKFYIGTHKTKDVNDDYMGSGKYLNRSIEKHGIENFSKDVLYSFDNPEDMFNKEREIVNEDFLAEENTYNLKLGGEGGWDLVNKTLTNKVLKSRAKLGYQASINHMIDKEKNIKAGLSCFKKKRGIFAPDFIVPRFKGKTHSEETKQKIGKANSKHQSGKGNSQYGSMWITDGKTNKKIKKNEPIPKGWKRGRHIL